MSAIRSQSLTIPSPSLPFPSPPESSHAYSVPFLYFPRSQTDRPSKSVVIYCPEHPPSPQIGDYGFFSGYPLGVNCEWTPHHLARIQLSFGAGGRRSSWGGEGGWPSLHPPPNHSRGGMEAHEVGLPQPPASAHVSPGGRASGEENIEFK